MAAHLKYKSGNSWVDYNLVVYPVGAYYFSNSSTSPASLFGGTWSAVTGRFLYMNAGTSTGGSNTHSLSVTEMPTHSHGIAINEYYGANGNKPPVWTSNNISAVGGWSITRWTLNNGDGKAHNNMPAYQTVYAWRRTA